MKDKAQVYEYLNSQDPHLVRLFHWVGTITTLANQVRESDCDFELFDELAKINNRLTHEIGNRIIMVLVCT